MSILSDRLIKREATERSMIYPFVDHLVSEYKGAKVISYGLSSYGYDIRCTKEFIVYKSGARIDPKGENEDRGQHVVQDKILVPACTYVMTESVEYFKMPRDVMGFINNKSTYARTGLIVNAAPIEPEWEGTLSLTLVNPTCHDVLVYAGEGIAQLTFVRADSSCNISYQDRHGKYQMQMGITGSKI